MSNPQAINQAIIVLHESREASAASRREMLTSLLTLGQYQSEQKHLHPSTKVRGQKVAKAIPSSRALDPSTRSDSTWLYEALNDSRHEASDIRTVLEVDCIFELGYAHPSAIRKLYNRRKKDVVSFRLSPRQPQGRCPVLGK